MNVFELLGCVLIIGAGIAGSIILGMQFGTWGYIAGAPIGIGIWLSAQYLLIQGEHVLRRFGGYLPKCRNGTCRSKDYRVAPDSRERELECRCGERYRLSGKILFHIDENCRITPYMRKLAWGRWVPAEPNSAKTTVTEQGGGPKR